jgi:hypothetical protein
LPELNLFEMSASTPNVRKWPEAAETNIRFHVGEPAQSGPVVLKGSFVEVDPQQT